MANWTNASLTVFVPAQHKQDFLDAVKGPNDWRIPVAAQRSLLSFSEEERSGHDRIELIAQREKLESAFRAHPACKDYPEWMPFSMGDAELVLRDEVEGIPETILSIPKINPIADRAEFDRYFPGELTDDYWELTETKNDTKSIVRYFFALGQHGLSLAKLGAHSILFNVRMTEKSAAQDGRVCLHFEFDVKNGSVTCFPAALTPVLQKFDAKALHVWEHNCESGGFDYMDPATDTVLTVVDDFDVIAESVGMEIKEQEDYDEENSEPLHIDWSDVLLYAQQHIKDADFDNLG
tara:strand:+ start:3768 stop:4646 length:879 start_codon:yes stop_codon:yes gene_type:complete